MSTKEYIEGVKAGEYLDRPTKYAIDVLEKKIIAGPYVRAACQRHLKDLDREDVIWDVEAGQYAIDFFEQGLVFTDGDKVGEPFLLQPWQDFIVGSLFGWKGEDGWRRFRTAYVEIGKGAGKSPLAGGIGLFLLAADQEGAAEVYAAATKLDQAKILWLDAKRMAEQSPLLRDEIEVKANLLAIPKFNSVFKPISSEKRGLDGPRVHGGLIDELHEHADAVLVDKLRAGTKARNQALILEITNSGFDKKTICYQHHEYSIRLVKGLAENDSWFGYVCGLDEGDDWETNENVWIKANPNLGISIQKKYLREQVAEARAMPAKRGIVARLNFCVWTGAEAPWVAEDKWMACQRPRYEIDAMVEGAECFLSADLSARKDLTAVSATFKLKKGLASKVFYFAPQEGVEERSKADRTPYDLWAEQGYIKLTPGDIVDYAFVAYEIKKLAERYNVIGLAYDPWKINDLKVKLAEIDVDIPLIKHAQGFVGATQKDALWMPKSIEIFEERILNGTYFVEESPVTMNCAAGAVIKPDPVGNRIFEKSKSTGRIDGTVAQAMSVGFAEQGIPNPEEKKGPSVYESRGLISLGG